MVDCKEEILKINHNLSTQIAQISSHSATGDCVSNKLLLGKIKKKTVSPWLLVLLGFTWKTTGNFWNFMRFSTTLIFQQVTNTCLTLSWRRPLSYRNQSIQTKQSSAMKELKTYSLTQSVWIVPILQKTSVLLKKLPKVKHLRTKWHKIIKYFPGLVNQRCVP